MLADQMPKILHMNMLKEEEEVIQVEIIDIHQLVEATTLLKILLMPQALLARVVIVRIALYHCNLLGELINMILMNINRIWIGVIMAFYQNCIMLMRLMLASIQQIQRVIKIMEFLSIISIVEALMVAKVLRIVI